MFSVKPILLESRVVVYIYLVDVWLGLERACRVVVLLQSTQLVIFDVALHTPWPTHSLT